MHEVEIEEGFEKNLFQLAKERRAPLNGSIELLPLCNLNCKMCYIRLSKSEMEDIGRIRSAEEWLKVGKQMQDAGVLFLLLTGGEPLLHPEFKDIYLALFKMGFFITINTNGTLIDEDMVAFFQKYKPRRINITLYGKDEDTYRNLCRNEYAYKKTINAIQLLKKAGVQVQINISLVPEIRDQLLDLYDIAHKLEVPAHTTGYMMPSQRERKRPFNQQSRLEPREAARASMEALQMENNEVSFLKYVTEATESVDAWEDDKYIYPDTPGCYAGTCSFSIDWQGNLKPCTPISEPAVSVFDIDFLTAWNQIVNIARQFHLPQECTKCRYRPTCQICRVSAFLETGSYEKAPEYMCNYAKETYRWMKDYLRRSNHAKDE